VNHGYIEYPNLHKLPILVNLCFPKCTWSYKKHHLHRKPKTELIFD